MVQITFMDDTKVSFPVMPMEIGDIILGIGNVGVPIRNVKYWVLIEEPQGAPDGESNQQEG